MIVKITIVDSKFFFLVVAFNVENVFSGLNHSNISRRVNVVHQTHMHLNFESLSTNFNVKMTGLKFNTALLTTERAGCAIEGTELAI
tara:strand:- start:1578 stop:1838 length:261 start_codon:yes stop_codon:yes gene_type:complete